jgi:choice-of-anchor A domain-containing protein
VGHSGLNVIRFTGNVAISGGTLNIVGPADSQWVFQMQGTGSNPLSLSGTSMNIGDINPDNMLWSVSGTLSGVVNITNGATLFGTILAPFRDITVQGSNATVNGAIIGGRRNGGTVQVHSSGRVILPENVPETDVPEPATLSLLGSGMLALAGIVRRRKLPRLPFLG